MIGPKLASSMVAVLAVAACSGAGNWTKSGLDLDNAAARAEYDDCRDLAATMVRTDTDIDQDILATRGADAQRGGAVRAQTQVMQEHSRDRAGSIVDKCMAAKGFVRAP